MPEKGNKMLALKCTWKDGVCAVTSLHGNLVLLGSSIPCGTPPVSGQREAMVHYFYPDLKEKEKGIIAFAIFRDGGKNRYGKWESAFFEIVRDGDKYHLELEVPAILDPAKLAVCSGLDLTVTIRNKIFTTSEFHSKNSGLYMVDGNILCAYLSGKLHASDVINEAKAPKVEANYLRLYTRAAEDLKKMQERAVKLEHDNEILANRARMVERSVNYHTQLPWWRRIFTSPPKYSWR